MKCFLKNFGRALLLMGAAIGIALPIGGAAAGEIPIRSGDSIAFVGDSNTANGWELQTGYVRLVMEALEQEGIKATPIPSGVAGDTSETMCNRIDIVLSKRPSWLILNVGFNDVWQVGFDSFRKNVNTILEKTQAAGTRLVLLTPALHKEDELDGGTNRKAAPYVEFLRQTAGERNLPVADLNTAHRVEMARLNKDRSVPRRFLTWDQGLGRRGTGPGDLRNQMSARGSVLVATVLLETLGFTGEQIAAAKAKWRDRPYRRSAGMMYRDITVGQFEKAEEFALREKSSSNEVLHLLWQRALVAAAREASPGADLKAVQQAAKNQFGKDLDALLESGLSIGDLR